MPCCNDCELLMWFYQVLWSQLVCTQTVFVLSVCCLFKGANLVCFISSAIVNTPRVRCLLGVNKLDNKLELCLPVRTREVEWKIENKHLRVFLFNDITPARTSKGPPTTSCVTVHQHFHVQSEQQRRNLISITASTVEHWHSAVIAMFYRCFSDTATGSKPVKNDWEWKLRTELEGLSISLYSRLIFLSLGLRNFGVLHLAQGHFDTYAAG